MSILARGGTGFIGSPLSAIIKPLAKKALPPKIVLALRAYRNRKMLKLAKLTNSVVLTGPFKGTKYPESCLLPFASSGGILAKLLGCYEAECHPFIEAACGQTYSQVINIGAGEGYYAVGLARRMPNVPIIAFEADASNRELCAALAAENGAAKQIRILGTCTPEALHNILETEALIICDCEGAEAEILRGDIAVNLLTADILVELHDFIVPGVSRTIVNRFSRSHKIEIVASSPRDPAEYPFVSKLNAEDQELFLVEKRPCRMEWAFMAAVKRTHRKRVRLTENGRS
jgi:hypothetical protein